MYKFSFFPSGWSTSGLGGVCLLIILVWACQQDATLSDTVVEEKGIEELMKNLEAMKQEAVSPLEGIHSSYQELQAATSEFKKSDEEIRQDLLSQVKEVDQADFKKELETVFDVGKEKAFFLRQIEYAQLKIDLAVVGIGIIRVHQVLRGENPSVKPKDTQEFIRYIKEQVQNALISKDKNYKAIVFKGIESSA